MTATKQLNKTDMILMQKETEKLARDAFARIQQTMANSSQENEIVLDWCFASVKGMTRVMTEQQGKSFTRKIRDFMMEKKGNQDATYDCMSQSGTVDFEMIKQ